MNILTIIPLYVIFFLMNRHSIDILHLIQYPVNSGFYMYVLGGTPFSYSYEGIPVVFSQWETIALPNVVYLSYVSRSLQGLIVLFPILTVIVLLIIFSRFLFERGIVGQRREIMTIEESANLIRGMLKTSNQIQISKLAELTGRSENFWEARIYTLIGKDTISGTFDGKVFTLSESSSIDHLIDSLFDRFDEIDKYSGSKLE